MTESPSTVRYTDRDAESTTRQREVIEDTAGDEGIARPQRSGVSDEGLDSSPPELEGDVDSEFEDLFAPTTTQRTKRRRLSLDAGDETPSRPQGRLQDDEPQSSWSKPPVTPFPRSKALLQSQNVTVATATPNPSTPATAKPLFRHHPRFMLSANASQQPPSSQTGTPFTPAPIPASQPPISTQQRRKPAFVLPRSPPPSRADEDASSLPTPFSPSSRTLRRRGRPRNNAPAYVSGGMAAEVRSWVLEMGIKREQSDLNFSTSNTTRPYSIDTRKYLLTARITSVRQAALASSGPLAFVQAQVISHPTSKSEETGSENDYDSRNILLMGTPRSRSEPYELKSESVIGVYRGLVWEIELREDDMDDLLRDDSSQAGLADYQPSNERWLVVMEWDLLQ